MDSEERPREFYRELVSWIDAGRRFALAAGGFRPEGCAEAKAEHTRARASGRTPPGPPGPRAAITAAAVQTKSRPITTRSTTLALPTRSRLVSHQTPPFLTDQ